MQTTEHPLGGAEERLPLWEGTSSQGAAFPAWLLAALPGPAWTTQARDLGLRLRGFPIGNRVDYKATTDTGYPETTSV